VRHDLKYAAAAAAVTIAPGWVVARHLCRHDVVVMNRQPTLHRMGLMGHLVVPMESKTFRLPLPVTTPYNADFDGFVSHSHRLYRLLRPLTLRVRTRAPYLGRCAPLPDGTAPRVPAATR
jgi:hypothetical protein